MSDFSDARKDAKIAQQMEEARVASEKDHATQYADKRGGEFFVIGGQRVHKSDLTNDQKKALLPKEEWPEEPKAPAVPAAPPAKE